MDMIASKHWMKRTFGSRPMRWSACVVAVASALASCAVFDYFAPPPANGLHELRSHDGVLETTLIAAPAKVTIGGATVDGKTYNGDYAGPVLRVHPGDHLKIKLVNNLNEQTNLHFHGLQTTPLGSSDNIHRIAEPGNTLDYDVPIPPFQPPGVYWYHAHIHGNTEEQIMGGLTGAIVVEGIDDRIPQIKGLKENLIVFKDMTFDDSPDPVISKQWHDRLTTINGLNDISLTSRPGETQLWRFANQAANLPTHFKLAGHKFRIISADGVPLNAIQETDTLNIGPANRFDVLVTASDKPGTYEFSAAKIPTGSGTTYSLNRHLGTLKVAGPAVTEKLAAPLLPPPQDLRTLPINERRQIVFTEDSDSAKYFINGKLFDINRIDTRLPLGNVEEWTLRNDTDDFHVFHIHQVHFQVTEINGKPQPLTGQVDTALVPERGSIKIILPFTNPLIVGQFVYHCHVLNHEDHGMMAHMEVYDPAGRIGAYDWIWSGICKPKPGQSLKPS